MHTDKVCFKICWNVGSHCKAQFFCRSAWLDQANLAQVSSHKGQDVWGIEATTHCCPIATANVAANFIFKWCCLPLKTSASMLKHLDWTAADVAAAKAKLSFSMWIEETFHPWYPVPSLLDSFILELKQPPHQHTHRWTLSPNWDLSHFFHISAATQSLFAQDAH